MNTIKVLLLALSIGLMTNCTATDDCAQERAEIEEKYDDLLKLAKGDDTLTAKYKINRIRALESLEANCD